MQTKRTVPQENSRFLAVLALMALGLLCFSGASRAQTTPPAVPVTPVTAEVAPPIPTNIEARVRVADAVTLVADKQIIRLWGVEPITIAPPVFDLNARTALANAIGGQAVGCEILQRMEDFIKAQCVSANDLDLGLFMIQQGYVSVDRAAVFGTVFESVYVQAEMAAQDGGLGIWGKQSGEGDGAGSAPGSLLLILGFILFLLIVGTFTVLSIIIMRGFRNVIKAQNDNLDMMSRERKLRDKERGIVAVMLDSELKANKSKIEAYIVVYEEILNSLKDPDKTPKYKTSGDIVQKQPVLSRAVFDRNTDKLDVLGQRLASALIHFYARIKSNPEYLNLETHMERHEAVEIVEDAVERAKRMNELADELLDSFEKTGVMSEVPQE